MDSFFLLPLLEKGRTAGEREREKSLDFSRACLSIVEDLDAPYRSGRSVGRSHAGSFVTRSTYSGQGPTPQALCLSLLSSPLSSHTRSPSCSLSYRPTFLTTRHCVPPRWNPVYSSTLWIFRKRFATTASPRLAFFPPELLIEPIINRWLESSVSTNRIARTFAKRGTWPLPDDDIPARERIERSQNEPRMRARGWFVRFGWRARTEADRMSQTSGNESAGC